MVTIPKEYVHICFPEHKRNRNIKKYLKQKNLKKSLSKSLKVNYFTQAQLNKLNPYLGSIVGISYLNLNAYNKTFKIFFPNITNASINEVILFNFGSVYPILPWSATSKNNYIKAFNQIGNYIGVKIVETTIFTDADYVNVNLNYGVTSDLIAQSTFPYDLDDYPEIYKDKLYIFWSSSFISNLASGVGTFIFETFLHEIGHSLGLAHPHDNGNDSKIMPGTSSDTSLVNEGLFSMNTTLTTVMSYIDQQENINKTATFYPRTLMELDLQALQYIYKATNNIDYISNWIDPKCKDGVVQTLVSTSSGLTITLTPTSSSNPPIFNLNLDKYVANPANNSVTANDVASRSSSGYQPNSTTFSFSCIDNSSFISRVNLQYQETNIYYSNFSNNIEVAVNSTNVKTINILLKDGSGSYNILTTATRKTITRISTKKVLTISNLNSNVTVSIIYGTN